MFGHFLSKEGVILGGPQTSTSGLIALGFQRMSAVVLGGSKEDCGNGEDALEDEEDHKKAVGNSSKRREGISSETAERDALEAPREVQVVQCGDIKDSKVGSIVSSRLTAAYSDVIKVEAEAGGENNYRKEGSPNNVKVITKLTPEKSESAEKEQEQLEFDRQHICPKERIDRVQEVDLKPSPDSGLLLFILPAILSQSHSFLRSDKTRPPLERRGKRVAVGLQSGGANLSLFEPPSVHSVDSAKNSPTPVGTGRLGTEKEVLVVEREGEEVVVEVTREVVDLRKSGSNYGGEEVTVTSSLASTTTTTTTASQLAPPSLRKPLPVNEPKPVLPPGKQLKMVLSSFHCCCDHIINIICIPS